jgi:hypothetical protein
MTGYREAGVELIQARAVEGRFEFKGVSLRLGVFNGEKGWYVGVHTSSGRLCARLSLEYAATQKEAKDMLQFGFFLAAPEESHELIGYLETIGLLSTPAWSPTSGNVSN